MPQEDGGNQDAADQAQRDRQPPATATPPPDLSEFPAKTPSSERAQLHVMPPNTASETSPSAPVQRLTQSKNTAELSSTVNASADQGQERSAPEPRRSNRNDPVRSVARVGSKPSTQRDERTSSLHNQGGKPLSTGYSDLTHGLEVPSIFPALPLSSSFLSSSSVAGVGNLVPLTNGRARATEGCAPEQQPPPNNHSRPHGPSSPTLLPQFLDDASRPPLFDVFMLPPPPLLGAGSSLFPPPLPTLTIVQPPEPSIPPLVGFGTFTAIIGDQALATLVNSQAPASTNLLRSAMTSIRHVTPLTMAHPSNGFEPGTMPATTIEIDIPMLSSQGHQGFANNNSDASTQHQYPSCACNVPPEALSACVPPEQQRSSRHRLGTRSHTSLPQFPPLIDDSGRNPLLEALTRPLTDFQGPAPQFILPPPFQTPIIPQLAQPTMRILDVGNILLVIGDEALATMVNGRSSLSSNPQTVGATHSGPMRSDCPAGLEAGRSEPPAVPRDAPATAPATATPSIMPVTTIELDIPVFSTDSLPVLTDNSTLATIHTSNSPRISMPLVTTRSPALASSPSADATRGNIVRAPGQFSSPGGTPNVTASLVAPNNSTYPTSPNGNATSQNNYFAILPLQAVTPTAAMANNSHSGNGATTPSTGATASFVMLEDQSVPAVTPGASEPHPTRYRFAVNISHSSPSMTPIVRLDAQPQDSPPPPVVPRPAVRSRTHMHSTQRQL